MKFIKLLPAFLLVGLISFNGCKPKDADIKTSIEKSLQANPATTTVMVMVNEGVATLSGEVANETDKTDAGNKASATKGVKSVVNNITITPPAAPVTISEDQPLMDGVRDATKDYPTVIATVNGGVITLNGELEKAKLQKLMMALSTLKPKSIDNKLIIK